MQALSEKDKSDELEFDRTKELTTKRNMHLQNSIYTNTIYAQQVKFEKEKKLKEKFDFFENDWNKNEKKSKMK